MPEQPLDEDEYNDKYPPFDPDYEENRGDYLYHLYKDEELDDKYIDESLKIPSTQL